MQGDLELQLDNTIPTPEDEERSRIREEYRQRLAEKLKDPEFRKIEGFPIGTDEAILALSDPPYYTACPNPFIEEWLQQNGKPYDSETDTYHCEPFAVDVSEGKKDIIYNAHSYHTKVPHKAIMRYILHYTKPGDVVYDGFCGSGMTGVAAQMCGSHTQIESLGFYIHPDGTITSSTNDQQYSFGKRLAVISDLSPIATFISYNQNIPISSELLIKSLDTFFTCINNEIGWMYSTSHIDGSSGQIEYTVWSEIFICPQCSNEIVFLDRALDIKTGTVKDEITCQCCETTLKKRDMSRVIETYTDIVNGEVSKRVKRVPSLIIYKVNGKRYEKKPDINDIKLLQNIEELPLSDQFPHKEIPFMLTTHVKDHMTNFGITHLSHFFLSRERQALSTMWKIAKQWSEIRTRNVLLFMVEQCIWNMTLCNAYRPAGFSQVSQYMKGVYYLPSQHSELSPWYILGGKSKRLIKVFKELIDSWECRISVNSCSSTFIPENTIDYIFTDPPFGENLQYSELNWLNESFYEVLPDIKSEAVVNRAQHKDTEVYMELMKRCLSENYRILKPGRWMTIEFHNSKNSIWNAIQEAIIEAGFIIADVRTLDKQGETYKQSVQGTVKADLVISCYKPRLDFEYRFEEIKGQSEGVNSFIRQHLDMLPVVPISKDGKIEVVAERTRYLLFDRMVAYHLQRGASIPVSAAEFYQMLNEQFVERDDMYFLPDQAARYDALRARTEIEQLSIFIRDEKSAVRWVRTELLQSSQTLGDLTPKFMQETRDWELHEPRPELRDLLKENFIIDKDGKWRVPDPNQEKDLEDLRLKGMLKTFENYVKTNGQLKIFRKEAIVEGFKHCWQTKQFGVIVALCERIPVKILQEVPEFVQFYDIAKDLAPTETAQLEFSWDG